MAPNIQTNNAKQKRPWVDSMKADNQRRASKWIRTVRANKIVVMRRVVSIPVARLREECLIQ
jgi:hypothetical protein